MLSIIDEKTQEPASTAGNITLAQQAGFPAPLLIPVAPPTASGMPPTAVGKAPAVIRPDGSWKGLTAWNHGTSAAVREQCDAAGCNAGLILGLQNNGEQFLAIDVDTKVGGPDETCTKVALEVRSVILKAIVSAVARPVWVRNTRLGRAAILLRLPPEQAPGSKATVHLHHAVHGDLGMIELLAKKQQIVIAGEHPGTRRNATWYRTDRPNSLYRVPKVDSGIPRLKDRAAVDSLLDLILVALAKVKVTHTRAKVPDSDRPFTSSQVIAEDRAAPSVDILISTLKAMPNPARADRHTYASVMLAVAGCIRSGRALKRISDAEERLIILEAAKWAARWEGPTPSSVEVESAKMRSDWLRRDVIFAGWPTLMNTAADLGVEGIGDQIAADEWEALEEGPPPIKLPPPWVKPVIQITKGDLPELVTAGEAALIGSGLPIFERGGMLVRPCTREVPASDGRMTKVTSFYELKVHAIMDLLGQCAIWEKANVPEKNFEAVDPPKVIAEVLLSRKGHWQFASIVGIIGAPTLRPDGSILSAPGYDKQTGLFNSGYGIKLSPSVENPTKAHALEAMAYLNELLSEFPFAGEMDGAEAKKDRYVDRAVALSAMLSSVVLGAVPKSPIHAFNASTSGSGKTELTDLVTAGATGWRCPASSVGRDPAELEKKLTSALLAGHQMINLDNCNGEIGGDLLCQAASADMVRLRKFGTTDDYDVPARSFIMTNGNGLTFRDDVVRRGLKCNLDARMERPETRNFKQRPVEMVLSDRSPYLSACLTIVRAYILAGRPDCIERKLGGFERWSDNVRSALVWLGCGDPLESMEQSRDEDPVLNALRDVIALWPESMRFKGHTVAEIIAAGQSAEDDGCGRRYEEWHTALQAVGTKGGVFDVTTLGKWLSRSAGRVIGKFRIAKDLSEAMGGSKRWLIEQMG